MSDLCNSTVIDQVSLPPIRQLLTRLAHVQVFNKNHFPLITGQYSRLLFGHNEL